MSKKDEIGIASDAIRQIESYCMALAQDSGDREFETTHLKAVLVNSLELAKARGLNTDIARLIALFHDVGRTKHGVYGKGHAEEGSAEAEVFLKKYDISPQIRKTIIRAIYNHNKKKKIHDEYSELIKDADTMSRYSGIPDYDDVSHEFLRNKYARIGKCRIKNNDDTDIMGLFYNKIEDLKSEICELMEATSSPMLVHSIRIKIRAIRAVIWYVKPNLKSNCRAAIVIIDNDLKRIFKNYEMPRKIHVLRKHLKTEFRTGAFMDYLTKIRKKELRGISKKAGNKHRHIIDEMLGRASYILPKCGIQNIQKLPDRINFKKLMKSADAKYISTLHRLRILCKKVMYLYELGVITFSQPDFHDLLKNLHRNIGLLNDKIENLKMLKKIKVKRPQLFEDGQYGKIVEFLERDNGLRKTVTKNIFELRLRI